MSNTNSDTDVFGLPQPLRSFGSDNHSGVHPDVLQAIVAANVDHTPSYGADPWSAQFDVLVRRLFGEAAEAYPMLLGTAANVVSLQAALPRWGAVICASSAHIQTSEGGAPEKVGGLKLLTVSTNTGKLTPELVASQAVGFGDVHRPQPLAVSIAQVTELGTCYTPDEIRALADFAHEHDMLLHMDGSRLSNAAAYLGCELADLTVHAGVDVLSLGATKNGAMCAEAVIAIQPERLHGIGYLRKLNMQLASKMRFVSAQLLALYSNDLWLRLAQHANEMAQRLATGIETLSARGLLTPAAIAAPVESNAVFAQLPAAAMQRVAAEFFVYPQDAAGVARLMCSFDTTPQEVERVVTLLAGEKHTTK